MSFYYSLLASLSIQYLNSCAPAIGKLMQNWLAPDLNRAVRADSTIAPTVLLRGHDRFDDCRCTTQLPYPFPQAAGRLLEIAG